MKSHGYDAATMPERPRKPRQRSRIKRQVPSDSESEVQEDILSSAIQQSIGKLPRYSPTELTNARSPSPPPPSRAPVSSPEVSLRTSNIATPGRVPPTPTHGGYHDVCDFPKEGTKITLPISTDERPSSPIMFDTQIGDLMFITNDRKIVRIKTKPGESYTISENNSGIIKNQSLAPTFQIPGSGTLQLYFNFKADVV